MTNAQLTQEVIMLNVKVSRLQSLIENGSGVNESSTISKLITTFNTNESETTIPGSSFDPPITAQPSIYRALRIEGNNMYDVSDLIAGFVKNGDYYDVVLTPIDQQVLNVKISVQ